jgi:hypothetical protein
MRWEFQIRKFSTNARGSVILTDTTYDPLQFVCDLIEPELDEANGLSQMPWLDFFSSPRFFLGPYPPGPGRPNGFSADETIHALRMMRSELREKGTMWVEKGLWSSSWASPAELITWLNCAIDRVVMHPPGSRFESFIQDD